MLELSPSALGGINRRSLADVLWGGGGVGGGEKDTRELGKTRRQGPALAGGAWVTLGPRRHNRVEVESRAVPEDMMLRAVRYHGLTTSDSFPKRDRDGRVWPDK